MTFDLNYGVAKDIVASDLKPQISTMEPVLGTHVKFVLHVLEILSILSNTRLYIKTYRAAKSARQFSQDYSFALSVCIV